MVAVELNNNHRTKSLQIVLCAFGFFFCGLVLVAAGFLRFFLVGMASPSRRRDTDLMKL